MRRHACDPLAHGSAIRKSKRATIFVLSPLQANTLTEPLSIPHFHATQFSLCVLTHYTHKSVQKKYISFGEILLLISGLFLLKRSEGGPKG